MVSPQVAQFTLEQFHLGFFIMNQVLKVLLNWYVVLDHVDRGLSDSQW